MIYTCTLNPSVDYIIQVANFEANGLNRGEHALYYPGGKGINVSRVLQRFNIENIALGFLGGFTGTFLKNELRKETISEQFIEVDGITRINMKLKSTNETEINGPGPVITDNQLEQLTKQITTFSKGDYLIASGSIPDSIPVTFYHDIAKLCEQKEVNFIVDTSSQSLKEVIGNRLFLIKPNHHELGQLFETTISSVEDALFYGKKLVEQGAKHVIVSMGSDGAVYLNKKAYLRASVPKGKIRNTVGAGDSMIAGFLSEYINTNDYQKAFKHAVATGSATAFSEDLCTTAQVEKIVPEVTITPLDNEHIDN